MKKHCPILLLFLGLLLPLISTAQSTVNDTILIIDNHYIKSDEFLWMFNKNSELNKIESELDLDQYMELFVSFKLKVAEAIEQGMDTDASFQRELRGYKTQLERNYLSDQTISNALLLEAYDRLQYDVNAIHVLVRLNDSVQEIGEANRLGKLLGEMPFEEMREKFHNGKTVFVEDLGYFTAFNMDYDFETVAFNTPIGSLSKPFKTKYGHHVLKVLDRVKSEGEMQVAHIMLADQPKDTIPSEQQINILYQELLDGADFSAIAQKYSDDPQSVGKGGRLNYFRRGQLASEIFESKCLSLKEIGAFTAPFQTQFGWHIVKLLDRKKMEPFEMAKSDLEKRIQRDGRSQKINQAFYNKLAKLYQVTYNNPQNNYLLKIIDKSYFDQSWQPPVDMPQDAVLFELNGQKIYLANFVNYLTDGKKRYDSSWSLDGMLTDAYRNFVNNMMYNKYQSELSDRFPEFRFLLNEYREGLFLFEVMQQNVWSKYPDETEDVVKYQETLEQAWVNTLKQKHKIEINTLAWDALKQELLSQTKK